MNAWLESGRSNTFSNVHPSDVVFRSSSQASALVLGNGIIPYGQAGLYIRSNCIGINRAPDTSVPNTRIVLDIGGAVACRSGMTWCSANTPPVNALAGSNATRASAYGVFLNNGQSDTIRLNRNGLLQTSGSVRSCNAVLGLPQTKVFSNTDTLTVIGKGVFDQGIRLVIDNPITSTTPQDNGSISYDPSADMLSVGARATINPQGLVVNGTVVSTGQVFAPGYRLMSDARLKKDIRSSDKVADLMDVLAVDIRQFKLADNGAERGVGPQTGVIANEIANILPDAVSRVHDYIPDVMCLGSIESIEDRGSWIVLQSTPCGCHKELKVGDNLRLRLGSIIIAADIVCTDVSNPLRICLLGCHHARISLRTAPPSTEVFVYGTLFYDVLAVDTSLILFKLVSAVQALHSMLIGSLSQ